MNIIGQIIERGQSNGKMEIKLGTKDGKIKLSKAAQIKLGITATDNKIGFAYPNAEDEEKEVYVFKAQMGFALNSGSGQNKTHNRMLRTHFGTGNEEVALEVTNEIKAIDYEGQTLQLHKLSFEQNTESTDSDTTNDAVSDAENDAV